MRDRWLFVLMIISIICLLCLVLDSSLFAGVKTIPDDAGTKKRVINKKEERKGTRVIIPGCSGSSANCYDDGTNVTCETCYGEGGMKNWVQIYNKKICAPNSVRYMGGELRCTPQGSFTRSCNKEVYWDASVLKATCKDKKGKMHKTELSNYAECTGDIANCNGNLTCGGCK